MVVGRKKICILGAGAAGLCAARHAADQQNWDVTIFEQQENIGGTWNYSPEINVLSSVYETMYTNLPKQVMKFEHLPLETAGPESFICHQEMLAYLERYAKPILHLIKFNTIVTKIKREGEKWVVETRSTRANLENCPTTSVFDVLFICNGHFYMPRIPDFAEKLKIPWLHCHNYRRPHGYTGKEIAIVGAGPSGIDISIQISKYAKKIHLLHNQKHKLNMPGNIKQHARMVGVGKDDRRLLLEDGEDLLVDEVIFCTGYRYEIPFCEKDLLEVKADAGYVSSLYQHCVHTTYPTSLFVIGLCKATNTFVCFDYQVGYAVSLINGNTRLPSKKELNQFEQDRLRELKKIGRLASDFHILGKEQWSYYDLLAKLSNRRRVPGVVQKIYDHIFSNTLFNNPDTFKSYRYRIIDEETFEVDPLIDLHCN